MNRRELEMRKRIDVLETENTKLRAELDKQLRPITRPPVTKTTKKATTKKLGTSKKVTIKKPGY